MFRVTIPQTLSQNIPDTVTLLVELVGEALCKNLTYSLALPAGLLYLNGAEYGRYPILEKHNAVEHPLTLKGLTSGMHTIRLRHLRWQNGRGKWYSYDEIVVPLEVVPQKQANVHLSIRTAVVEAHSFQPLSIFLQNSGDGIAYQPSIQPLGHDMTPIGERFFVGDLYPDSECTVELPIKVEEVGTHYPVGLLMRYRDQQGQMHSRQVQAIIKSEDRRSSPTHITVNGSYAGRDVTIDGGVNHSRA